MRILLTGKNGQVGHELERCLQGLGEIVAPGRDRMDLSDLDQVRDMVREVRPDLIVNPAAYTAVDRAESEPELAMRINAEAPGVMAEEAKKLGAAMIHYSTDYVFNGRNAAPYVEDDPTDPINIYGRSKLAGEEAVRAAGIAHLILRTSWVYGMRGKNFLLTMLRLAKEREELRIVGDQHGSPTWCRTVADSTAHVVAMGAAAADRRAWWLEHSGTYHLTAAGQTTWVDFTREIIACSGLEHKPRIVPIATSEYPTPAQRPMYSVLSCRKFAAAFCGLPDWKESLRLCMER